MTSGVVIRGLTGPLHARGWTEAWSRPIKGITKVWKAFLLRFIFLFTIGCPRVWIDPGLETARNGQDQLSVSRISPSVPTSRIIDARRLSLIGIRELVNALCLRACRPWYLFHDDERRSAGRSMRAYLPRGPSRAGPSLWILHERYHTRGYARFTFMVDIPAGSRSLSCTSRGQDALPADSYSWTVRIVKPTA